MALEDKISTLLPKLALNGQFNEISEISDPAAPITMICLNFLTQLNSVHWKGDVEFMESAAQLRHVDVTTFPFVLNKELQHQHNI